jgi:hypothetical protein
MKTWVVYFELFGKKMKTEVQADSFYAAQCKVKDKIIFHKTEEKPGSELSDYAKAMAEIENLFKK